VAVTLMTTAPTPLAGRPLRPATARSSRPFGASAPPASNCPSIVVEPGPGDRYTVTVGSQGVHGLRDALSKVLKSDPQSLHVTPVQYAGHWQIKR